MELHVPHHGPFRWGLLILHFPGGLWTQTQHFCLGKLSEQLISLLGFQQSWFVYHWKSSESWSAVCAVTRQTFISPLGHTGCSKQRLSLTTIPAIVGAHTVMAAEKVHCVQYKCCLSYVSETPLLAPGSPTFLDLVRVYRFWLHDLAAWQFYGMWVNSTFLTAAQSEQYFTFEGKHMHSPTLASVGY